MKTFYNWMESASSLGAFVDAVIENRTDYGAYMMLADRLEESNDFLGEFLQLALKSHENLSEEELKQVENRFNLLQETLVEDFSNDSFRFQLSERLVTHYFPPPVPLQYPKNVVIKVRNNSIYRNNKPIKAINLQENEIRAIIFILCEILFNLDKDNKSFEERTHNKIILDILREIWRLSGGFQQLQSANNAITQELNKLILELEHIASFGPLFADSKRDNFIDLFVKRVKRCIASSDFCIKLDKILSTLIK